MLRPGFFFLGEGVQKSVFLSPGGLEHSNYSGWTTLLFIVRNSAPVITACLWPYRKSTLIKVFSGQMPMFSMAELIMPMTALLLPCFLKNCTNINKRGQKIFLDFRVKIRNPRAWKYPSKSQVENKAKFCQVYCMWKNYLSLVHLLLSLLSPLNTHI